MKPSQKVIAAYLALLVLALPVPLLHHYQTGKVIESMRPVLRLDDGTYMPVLMPVTTLLLRYLGEVSWLLLFILLALFVLSFWRESLARVSTVCGVAICQCAFTTFYALYATFIIGFEWLHR